MHRCLSMQERLNKISAENPDMKKRPSVVIIIIISSMVSSSSSSSSSRSSSSSMSTSIRMSIMLYVIISIIMCISMIIISSSRSSTITISAQVGVGCCTSPAPHQGAQGQLHYIIITHTISEDNSSNNNN